MNYGDNIKNLLTSAKKVHMNTIRVWGGGVYENDEFYNVFTSFITLYNYNLYDEYLSIYIYFIIYIKRIYICRCVTN